MRHLLKTFFLILGVMVLLIWQIVPPEKQLRLGKDLRGGVSLTYSVQIDANEDAKQVMARTIDVLKRRVDPDGLLEISMVAQGRDRIEITMPLPNERVKGLRSNFENALADLGRTRLSEARIDAVMGAGADRAEQLARLAGGNSDRQGLLEAAAKAYDQAQQLRTAYDAETDQAKRDALAGDVARAQIAYGEAVKAVLNTALNAAELRKVVQASTRQRFIDDNGQRVPLPTAREVAERQLRAKYPADKFPETAREIDRILGLHAAYAAERTTLDDPQDLIRMLRGAGVLSFRIAARVGQHPEEQRLREEMRALGPRNVRASDAAWYRINQIENWINTKGEADALALDPNNIVPIFARMGYVAEAYGGDYYMLLFDTRTTRLTQAEGTWAVAGAGQGVDQRGRPAINFQMNPAGAVLLSKLTGAHLQEPMAILLDDQVYTAPNLLGEIGSNGQITGEFPKEELDYIIRVLAGGSLQAKLSPEPLSVNSIGPELGADNLRMGFESAILSVIVVALFMCLYYFWYGGVAVVALLANALMIVGAMALSKAAFTMPGIAGLILTFGMAVDSNVLVYERVREELNRGADMKTAVRLGFDKALSAIVDGNITNLIVCVVLYYTGTPEIRGFAITMGIGVVATLIAALIVSRFVFNVMLAMGWKRGSVVSTHMLPTAIPGLQKWLTPSVDWIRLRWVFLAVSVTYVLVGLGFVVFQGPKLLDNEFRGGTRVTLEFKPVEGQAAQEGVRLQRETMSRADVEQRVHAIAEGVASTDALNDLRFAEVFPIEPEPDGVTSSRFVIQTVAQNTNNAVLDAIKARFLDKLESKPALNFAGHDAPDARRAPVFPIDKPTLGENIGRPALRQNITQFVGGVAVLLEGMEPAPSLESLRSRLENVRQGEAHSDTLSRQRDLIIIEGDETAVRTAVLLVRDEAAGLFENEARWEADVRDREWAIVAEALTRDSTPASVVTFSPTIADTFRANAITATILSFILIGIYIWVRFKTPRYSVAAVVALVHDVITVVGFVALAEFLYENAATHGFAARIGLLPFKIDLNMVAALLTIAGYSLNDTVVIMDRIRENRGKLTHATRDIINTSINQTFSRTLITGGTTLLSCLIIYVMGGEGMRAFAYALFIGLIVGTYSSVAVAAPIVWSRKQEEAMRREAGLKTA